MKKMISVLLTLALLLSLAACGAGEEDPNAGIYTGVSGTMSGFTMDAEELFEGGCSLELKSGGRGTVTLGADSFGMKWALEGENITITISGEDSTGTLKDGVIDIEFMGMGLILTFVRDEAAA